MVLLLARTGAVGGGGIGMEKSRCTSLAEYPAGINDWVLDGMKMTSPGLLFLCFASLVLFFDKACKVTGVRRRLRRSGIEDHAV